MRKDKTNAQLIMVITTVDNLKKANSIKNEVLESKLAACISSREINTSYWWEGKIDNQIEFELVMKTNSTRLEDLVEKLIDLHDYKLPEIIHMPFNANDNYKSWVEEIVSSPLI